MAFATQVGGVVATRLYIAGNGNIEVNSNMITKAAFAVGNTATSGARTITYQNNANGYQFGVNSACTQFEFLNGAPTVVATVSGSSGIYTPLSDINKKKDFEESTIGLKEVLQLKPTLFRFKDGEENAEKDLGFIAQEVKEFIPQAYVESGEGEDVFIGLQDRPIIAALVKSVQELEARIKELEAK
jgi:hypothetical protein